MSRLDFLADAVEAVFVLALMEMRDMTQPERDAEAKAPDGFTFSERLVLIGEKIEQRDDCVSELAIIANFLAAQAYWYESEVPGGGPVWCGRRWTVKGAIRIEGLPEVSEVVPK